jgi:hypothetical protein
VIFVPKALIDLFTVNRDTADALRVRAASLEEINKSLERELASLKVQNDWLRIQFNQLQFERAALIEKVYGLKIPAPELTKPDPKPHIEDFSFDDVGDAKAREMGLPLYGH